MDLTPSQQFADFIHHLKLSDVPQEVVNRAKYLLLDALGLCFAAADMEYSKVALQVAQSFGGKQESTVIGQSCRIPAVWAALVNGIQIHGHDYDDSHAGSLVHTTSVIVPIVLALAERNQLEGIQILESLISGLEMSCRVGLAAKGRFQKRGFHATPLAGVMGGVLAASRLMGLDVDKTCHAQGIAGSTAAGLREAYLSGGSWTKLFHPGWAAHGAITAALLAQKGFTGTPTIYEGRFGLFKSHLYPEDADYAALLDNLGERWEIDNIHFKPYPCGNIVHAFIDSVFTLQKKYFFTPEEIKQITCYIHPDAAQTVCEPISSKSRPESGYDAKFSLQFAVAAALVDREVTYNTFKDDKIRDPNIMKIVDLVTYKYDCDSPYPASFPSWLEIALSDGRVIVDRQGHNKGSKENPMTIEEITDKFFTNASAKTSQNQANGIYKCIKNLEDLKEISLLSSYLSC